MATVSPQMHLFKWFVLMISIISMISNGRARVRILVSNKVTGSDKPKGVVKTVESYETGEVIDCVDIFKQPAFDHPLLKNHTIQMKPSSNCKANGAGYVEDTLRQVWWKYGECPEGTIPVKRRENHTKRHVIPLTSHLHRLNLSGNDIRALGKHEHAKVITRGGNYYGAHAEINAWKPTVMETEASFSQIWLSAGPYEDVNTVEAIWMSDGYRDKGCFDGDCAGFVHTNRRFALGAVFQPVSVYGGQQHDLSIDIMKVPYTGSWWLHIMDTIEVGYWPWEIFTYLRGPANRIDWGGEVASTPQCGSHTSTQMGSGHFPSEGFGRVSYFRNLKSDDEDLMYRDPENLVKHVRRPECYDLQLNVDPPNLSGFHFYYGVQLSVQMSEHMITCFPFFFRTLIKMALSRFFAMSTPVLFFIP